jgi:hypothetical protein
VVYCRMVMSNESPGMWEVLLCRRSPGGTQESHSVDTQFPSRDSNRVPPE